MEIDDTTRKVPEPDWTPLFVYPPSRITCKCGEEFAGYAKAVGHAGVVRMLLRDPCPGCGQRMQIRRVSSSESVTLRPRDIQSLEDR